MRARDGVVGVWSPEPVTLEGLAGPVGQAPFLGLPLRERQERALIEAGVRPAEGDPGEALARVVVRSDAAITLQAVAALVEKGAEMGEDIRWVTGGRAGGFASQLAFGAEPVLLAWLAPGGPVTVERLAAARPVEFDPAERLIELPVPRSQFGADVLELPLTEKLVLPTAHWLQLLWANLLGLAPFLWRQLAGRNVAEVAWRLFWATLRAGSVQPLRVGSKLNRVGRDVSIHPSAVVEGCWLGDNVTIGAGAVVRASVLADAAAVEDLALVEGCVLAPGARVQRQAMAKYSVLGPRAALGGVVQLGVLDRDATVKRTGTLMDQALGQGGVRVQAAGALRPAPLGLAGVCVGEGSVVAANVAVAPGRCIPPGVSVFPPPGDIVRRIPDGLSGAVTVRDGRLEPM
jgi:carbonic anhydrase/acetyltransferase-like protein (isoleucine patch superfamily)